MGRLLIISAIAAVLPLFADNAKSQYDALKADAHQAQAAGNLRVAEAKYTELLALAERIRPGAQEVYANVVTPLADIYRKSEKPEKVEQLYTQRVERALQSRAEDGLELGLAQADLGFLYQNSDVSADRFHGERFVQAAMKTFEQCGSSKASGEQCRRRLADTAGIQGAIFFQNLDYRSAEPLFRRVVALPDEMVQPEVLFISLHALRGIVLLRKEHDEANALETRAGRVEANNRAAVARLKGKTPGTATRSRTTE